MPLDTRRRFLRFLALSPLAGAAWAHGLPQSPLRAPTPAGPPVAVFDYEPSARQCCRAHITPAALRGGR